MSVSSYKIFQPLTLGSLVLKNRIMCSPCHLGWTTENGIPTRQYLQHYETMAEGQCGLIIPGCVYPCASGRGLPTANAMTSDADAAHWIDTIQRIHKAGSKLFFQVNFPGLKAPPHPDGSPLLGPSAVGPNTRAMTTIEIEDTIREFRDVAIRTKNVGADGIQLHAGHSQLICQFLSPVYNHRTDRYGGSVRNRGRYLWEICDALKDVCNSKFLLTMKINGKDMEEDGSTPQQTAEVLQYIPNVHLAEISGFSVQPKEGYNLDAAKIIKAANPKLPIACVGGFRTLSFMEDSLQRGFADIISLGRPFIAQPSLVKDLLEQKVDRVNCKDCNQCINALMTNKQIKCYNRKD
jgi:2,4-dienoyl-CoA reductase-like NADH-dependent reductase (Old Yellow Enzyme family)